MLKSIMVEKEDAFKSFDKRIKDYIKNQPKIVKFEAISDIVAYDIVTDERNTEMGYFVIVQKAILEVITNTGSFVVQVKGSLGKHAASSVGEFTLPKMSKQCAKVLHNAMLEHQYDMCEQYAGFLKGLHFKLGLLGEKECYDYEFNIELEAFET